MVSKLIDRPKFLTPAWQSIYEIDLILRQASIMFWRLHNDFELNNAFEEPFIRNFMSKDDATFEGISLGRYQRHPSDCELVIALNPPQLGASLHSPPAVGVSEVIQVNRPLTYELTSIYRMWVTYRVRPNLVFERTVERLNQLVSAMLEDGLYMPHQLGDYNHFFHGVDFNHIPWLKLPS